jgi:hypothetical protein
VPSLIAPALLLFETERGHVVDGQAIALSSAVLFLLVMLRMAELVRRFEDRTRALAERDRSARLVLDTINEGLVRVAGDGTMAEERSAMIDRWLGAFAPGTRFADHVAALDPQFAEWFRIGHDAWLEGTLPAEVCLAQLPHRLHGGARELTVTYLPMADGRGDKGLLLVINDVSERVRLQQQEVEQRELLALSHGLTRDRVRVLALLDELGGWVAELGAREWDVPAQRRLLQAIAGRAQEAGLDVVARIAADADAELEEHHERASIARIQALRARWRILMETVRVLVGERRRDLIELPRHELELLDQELARGLSPAALIARLRAWRRDPNRPQA